MAIKELDTRGQKRKTKMRGDQKRGKREDKNPEMINYICKFSL